MPKTVGLHLQQAKAVCGSWGLNIGKISFDEGINLLNQQEARVYPTDAFGRQPCPAGCEGRSQKLTLDAAKSPPRRCATIREMIKAAELRRLDAETADSLARVRLDSLPANRPSKRSRSSTTGFSRTKRQRKTNFSNNARPMGDRNTCHDRTNSRTTPASRTSCTNIYSIGDQGKSPLRLDKFLTIHMERCSRSFIQTAADAGNIWSVANPRSRATRSKPGDRISCPIPS
ncbi:MAG: hypothetical protein ACLVJK_02965 [Alistipes putredinis]